MRTLNPVLKDDIFLRDRDFTTSERMSVEGTIHRSITALALCFLSAIFTWNFAPEWGLIGPFSLIGGLGGFIIAIITIFKKSWAAFTTPLYAILEGALLGGISFLFEQSYPGIVFQAVVLSFGVLFAMLLIYRLGIIKVTDRLRIGITAAIGAIVLVYFVGFIMSFFGAQIPYIHQAGPIGIGFSLVVVGIAAFSLLLDFDSIERGAAAGLPKYMEWFAAFGLLVTLVWLYLEMLQLLSKLQQRR